MKAQVTPSVSYALPLRYRDYVEALSLRNPSLLALHKFLSNPKARRHGCRLGSLEFYEDRQSPVVRRDIDINELSLTWQDDNGKRSKEALGERMQGQVLIVEDLTVGVIEQLGTRLNLDPMFLAMHLHTVQRKGMRHQTPDDANLPSRFRSANYINITYQHAVTSDDKSVLGKRLLRDTAIDRKIAFLKSGTLGFAQHCTSVVKLQHSPNCWLALVLVDPPLGGTYFEFGHKDDPAHIVHVNVQPYLGPYEEFTDLPSFTDNWASGTTPPSSSLLDELMGYWEHAIPSSFDPSNPTIQSLSFYPLRIAAAEWVKYIAVMQRCLKQYEYQGDDSPDLDKFNTDLRELQGWRRRSMLSQEKIRSVIRRLQPRLSTNMSGNTKCDESMQELVEDLEFITAKIDNAGRRLENMLPVVTSLVQIMDARQSFAETANIRRLTILALLFVPLSYVSSLFSMNEQNMPGSPHFWVYFAVAVPVTVAVFVIALAPTEELRKAFLYMKRHTRRRRPPPHPSEDFEPERVDSIIWKRTNLSHHDTGYTVG